MVIWITGMSGAGKTTLCVELRRLLSPTFPELVLLDGDAVRDLYGHDLDYTESGRVMQIVRLRALAQFLSAQGQLVLVAALFSRADLLEENRRGLSNYFEVYLKAPMELLKARDTKGLYSGAAMGQIKNVVGVDLAWNEPVNPDLVLDASMGSSPLDFAKLVIQAIPRLRQANERPPQ